MTDTAHSQHVTDHAFDPGDRPWWALCSVPQFVSLKPCNLSEAAHRDTTLTPEDRA
jgi:hypothetical protein